MNNRAAMITGGTAGIGRKTAELLAAKGFSLAINYRSRGQEAARFAEELMNLYGVKCEVYEGDISRTEDCERIAEAAVRDFGGIDILINNAGPYVHERKKMADYSFEEWNTIVAGNLTSVFYLSKLLIPGMREKGWGRIITLGYDRAETAPGWIYRSAFASAKSGLASLTRTIAIEEAPFGITANMVCPGDITSEWKEKAIFEADFARNGDTPVGRQGTGEDIARVIAFLLEEDSGFITGSVIPVTGGMDVLGKIYRQ